jgi:hypothetical protein
MGETPMNLKHTIIFALALFASARALPGLCAEPADPAQGKGATRYLFAFFVDGEIPGGGAGLHLAQSSDGLNWSKIGGDHLFFKPSASPMVRDPNIARGPDGVFHMVWTTGWDAKGIGYASSTDLIHWSQDRIIRVMADEPNARNCWAPELIYDDASGEFVIYWSTTIPGRFPATDKSGDDGYNHRIYYTTTRDFNNFSPTKLLYNPGFNCIDATIVKADGKYVMFLKNETRWMPKKHIVVATSDRAQGPYGKPSRPISPDWVEGPTAIRIGGAWLVYFDQYTRNRYGVVTSADLKNWKNISDQLHMPAGVRHGTIFQVPPEIAAALENEAE